MRSARPTVFNYIGNAVNSSETFAGVTLTAPTAPANSLAIFRSTTTGIGTNTITSTGTISRGAGTFAQFIGGNDDLGTADNRLFFNGLAGTPTAPTFLPYGTVISAGGAAREAVHDTTTGIHAANNTATNFYTSLAAVPGAGTGTEVVRVTKSETLTSAKNIGTLIIAGDNITINAQGAGAITVASGSLVMSGAGAARATIAAPLTLGVTSAEAIVQVEEGNTLTVSSVLSFAGGAANTLRKRGLGTLTLSGANSTTGAPLTGLISVEQGVLRAGSNDALGVIAQATTVQSGATLEIAGGLAIGVGATNEPITINGTGFNNTGALRLANDAAADSYIGTNEAGNAISVGTLTTATVNTGTSGRTLVLNGAVLTGTLTKIGTGDLTLMGSAANTSAITVAENNVNLAKTAAVAAATTLTIGNDLGGDNAQQAIVTGVNAQTASTGVTIASTGRLDVNGRNFTANAVTGSIGTTNSADIINSGSTMASAAGAVSNSAVQAVNGIVTFTTTAAHGLTPGQQVSISGVSVSGYNGTFTLLTASGSTFTYFNPIAGLANGNNGAVLSKVASLSATISNATAATNTVTITTSGNHNFTAGQTVTISGIATAGYNGTFTLLTAATNTFTYFISSA